MSNNTKKSPPSLPADPRIREKRKYPEMSLSDVLKIVFSECGNVLVQKYGTAGSDPDADAVLILPRATQELYNMIYWGEKHPINIDEQLYQGMGHIIMDGQRRIIVISHFLYIYASERNGTSAHFTKGKTDNFGLRLESERSIYTCNEKECNRRPDGLVYDPLLELAGLSEAVLYGHTHPNLGVFFSEPDRGSGFATPDLPAVTFVTDPIRKEMKAGVGIELRDANIFAFSYKEKSSENQKKKKIISENTPIDSKSNAAKKAASEALLTDMNKSFNELVSSDHGAKGKFSIRTTIGGSKKVKVKMKIKPEKDTYVELSDTEMTGETYDSYA